MLSIWPAAEHGRCAVERNVTRAAGAEAGRLCDGGDGRTSIRAREGGEGGGGGQLLRNAVWPSISRLEFGG